MLDVITTSLMLVLWKVDNILSQAFRLTWTAICMHLRPPKLEAIITVPLCYHAIGFTCRGFPLFCWQSNHCLFLSEVNISYLHTDVCQRCDRCGSGGPWPLLNVSLFDIPVIELLQSVIHLLSPKWVPCEDRCMSAFFSEI